MALSRLDEQIWMLHVQGYAPSEIAAKLDTSPERVRACVALHWALDKQSHRVAGMLDDVGRMYDAG